ncbi:hypothetical protein GCM10027053_11520 [Intrasporangium mesophilum]
MTDYKQRSLSQRLGTAGENQFRLMAERQHLIVAAKVAEDFGVDFMCQAEESADTASANPVIPAHFGVCVRATKLADGRVKLNRADASNMLRYRQPLVFVLVHLVDGLEACYYRVMDPEFGGMLSRFLDSRKKTKSLTPADCRPEPGFRSDLIPALKPSATRRTQLALAEIRLRSLVPGATVEINIDKDGETAIIVADDYFDFFEKLPEKQRNSVYRAAFGRPDLFDGRTTSLPFNSAIPEALVDAPDRIVIGGSIVSEDATLEISGPEGTARAPFTYTRIGTHYGWVHTDGLALTVSAARPRSDGVFVHETRVLIDDEADISLDDLSSDLRKLLMVAVPDAILREADSGFAMEVDYFGLPRLCELVRAHADARQLRGWDPAAIQLRDLNDQTSRLAIMMLGTWSVAPALFPKIGLYLDSNLNPIDLDNAERVEKPGLLTVVLDTARKTIIATASGLATELWFDGRLIGLASFTARTIELDIRASLARGELYPEIVVGEGISMVLDPSGVRMSETPAWFEELGYRRLDEHPPE